MKLKPVSLIASAALLTFVSTLNPIASSSVAQESSESGANVSQEKGEPSEEAQQVENLHLAYNLAEYGRENEDPQMLIAAAKIVMETPVEFLTREKTSESDENTEASTTDNKPDEELPLSAMELLEEAREFAQSQPEVLAMIDNVEESAEGSRGRVGGPARHVDRVLAYTTDQYRIPFRGGRRAAIAVRGDGDTDLDCYVYDENGNLVDSATDYSDTCLLEWYPRWTGSFRLRIKNRGRVYNQYQLLSN
ncbi:UNVERIFIED_CONTAM: hypothetical protein BEN50_11565 [Euhalothece sp. KZN 001]